jgi:hypothetical protein
MGAWAAQARRMGVWAPHHRQPGFEDLGNWAQGRGPHRLWKLLHVCVCVGGGDKIIYMSAYFLRKAFVWSGEIGMT